MENLVFVRYWTRVLPQARRELAYWRLQANCAIGLERRVALDKLTRESHNVESAACFALLADNWRAAVRRVVSFETAYELLDGLNEQQPQVEQGLRLHAALTDAVSSPGGECDGYLGRLLDACRGGTSTVLVERTRQIGQAQSLNHAGHDMRAWGEAFAPRLLWWEAAGAGICSLGVLAMLSTAPSEHQQIRDAYVLIDALAALLDALVDLPDDHRTGNRNWLDHYPTERMIAERLEALVIEAFSLVDGLPTPRVHRLILIGLLAHCLVAPGDHLPLVRLRLISISSLVRAGAVIFRARGIFRKPVVSDRVLYRTERVR